MKFNRQAMRAVVAASAMTWSAAYAAQGNASHNTSHAARIRTQDAALVKNLRGKLQRVSMPQSPILKRKITAWIYLPPDYNASTRCYPVVYLLHGAPGEVRDCFVNARVHRVAEQLIMQKKIAPLILVGFNGCGPHGPSDVTNFLDRADGTFSMEDFIVKELVPWIDAHYRTLRAPQKRALIGFSAGGYGAANLGFKHPGMFGVLASHSGFFDPHDDAKTMRNILGDESTHAVLWSQNSPLSRARTLPHNAHLHFYMDIGRDDMLLREFRALQATLKTRGVDCVARIRAGAHSWQALTSNYFDSLRFAGARFEAASKRP